MKRVVLATVLTICLASAETFSTQAYLKLPRRLCCSSSNNSSSDTSSSSTSSSLIDSNQIDLISASCRFISSSASSESKKRHRNQNRPVTLVAARHNELQSPESSSSAANSSPSSISEQANPVVVIAQNPAVKLALGTMKNAYQNIVDDEAESSVDRIDVSSHFEDDNDFVVELWDEYNDEWFTIGDLEPTSDVTQEPDSYFQLDDDLHLQINDGAVEYDLPSCLQIDDNNGEDTDDISFHS